MTIMPSAPQPKPGYFARAISDEIRLAMARHRVTGSQLAEMTGRSQSYVSKRLRNEASLTANDVEAICEALEEDLFEILRAAIIASRRAKSLAQDKK